VWEEEAKNRGDFVVHSTVKEYVGKEVAEPFGFLNCDRLAAEAAE